MSGSFRSKLPRRTDRHHSVQIIGQNAESHPRIGPIPTPQATTPACGMKNEQIYTQHFCCSPVSWSVGRLRHRFQQGEAVGGGVPHNFRIARQPATTQIFC